MITLKSKNRKHTVCHNGNEIDFFTLRCALIYIKLIQEGAFK